MSRRRSYRPQWGIVDRLVSSIGLLGSGFGFGYLLRAARDQPVVRRIAWPLMIWLVWGLIYFLYQLGDPRIEISPVRKLVDATAIFLTIAGVYLPFFWYAQETFGSDGRWARGWWWVRWGALIGITLKRWVQALTPRLAGVIYLILIWSIWRGCYQLYDSVMNDLQLALLVGSFLYSLAVITFLRESWSYHHEIGVLLLLMGVMVQYRAVVQLIV
jgi:channel protein (hemolysin III family)